MTKSEKSDLQAYFNEAKSWETSRVKELLDSRKTAWRVAGVAAVLAIIAVGAVAGLTPLKEVSPYVIRVDNSTGVVDVVEALTDGKTNYEEAVNKYFTQWYVRYREGYSKDLAEEYYYNVGLMSNSIEQQKYYQAFNPKNPQSPLNVYGPYAKVKIRIKGTSFISPHVALVRYVKEVERGLDKPQATHWAATITFKYTKAPMSERDREVSPLGFQVTEYRNDPDAVIPEANGSQNIPAGDAANAPNAVLFPTVEAQQPQTGTPAVAPALK